MDFVVTWVDDKDPEWLEQFYKYRKKTLNDDSEFRFRSWENFHYWFRGVEKFAPWVNKVHLVTWGHIPKWLNTKHPKLNIVKHSDFIPKEYLPTFNTRTIELNFHRIKGISEEFVVFNDDVFLINKVSPKMFFVNGKPCDMPIIKPLDLSEYSRTILNDMIIINKHFNLKQTIQSKMKNWFNISFGYYNLSNLVFYNSFRSHHVSFKNFHIALPTLKSTLQTLWQKEYDTMHKSSKNTFRDPNTVNNYIHRYWDLASNKFHPINISKLGKHFDVEESNLSEVKKTLTKQLKSIICINDSEFVDDFHFIKNEINKTLELIFPKKSNFEI